ncbi:MAG: ATP phosphoribosyltransferase [Gammaproteobacteria bacterium]|nr:ATP phosphoribosyltransferase [Gammaproteobacteria bacterium]
MNSKITLAISKGRILEDTVPLLERMGMAPIEDLNKTRKLLIDTENPNVRVVVIRATDVPTYVQYGAADLGIAGKDTLMETQGEGLYELLDLQICKCKLMVAGKSELPDAGARLKVATKYVHSAQQYFAQQGKQVEIIKLYGSMELAPLTGLADLIVDLVDTGNTLRANGLQPLEHIEDISSRLVANKASLKVRFDTIQHIVEQFRKAIEEI